MKTWNLQLGWLDWIAKIDNTAITLLLHFPSAIPRIQIEMLFQLLCLLMN